MHEGMRVIYLKGTVQVPSQNKMDNKCNQAVTGTALGPCIHFVPVSTSEVLHVHVLTMFSVSGTHGMTVCTFVIL